MAFTARCPGPRAPAPAVPPAGCPVCDLLCSFRNRGAPMRGRRPTSVGLEGCNAGADRSGVSRPSDEDDGFMVSEFFLIVENRSFSTPILHPGVGHQLSYPWKYFLKHAPFGLSDLPPFCPAGARPACSLRTTLPRRCRSLRFPTSRPAPDSTTQVAAIVPIATASPGPRRNGARMSSIAFWLLGAG